MTDCTAPGCGQPATLQWQRDADQTEADHAIDTAQASQVRIHKHQLAAATSQLLEARRRHADAVDAIEAAKQPHDDPIVEMARRLDAHRAQVVLPTLADHAATAEAAVDQLAAAGPATITPPDTVTVAVFGCDTHRVSDAAATWTHQVGCLTDPPGQCTCTPPANPQE